MLKRIKKVPEKQKDHIFYFMGGEDSGYCLVWRWKHLIIIPKVEDVEETIDWINSMTKAEIYRMLIIDKGIRFPFRTSNIGSNIGSSIGTNYAERDSFYYGAWKGVTERLEAEYGELPKEASIDYKLVDTLLEEAKKNIKWDLGIPKKKKLKVKKIGSLKIPTI